MAEPETPSGWRFAIDRGGTFTDTVARDPSGRLHLDKRLSSDTAPVEAIRAILEGEGLVAPGATLPPSRVRLGTTVATNALLERRGEPVLLVTNEGLGDVLRIGTQERPALFDLAIERPAPLQARVLEVPGRIAADGRLLEPLDEVALRRGLEAARAEGIDSVALLQLHAYLDPALEERMAEIARSLGFSYVVASSELAREMGHLARGETAAADAYLTPLLQRHVQELVRALPGSDLRFMQSSGVLTRAEQFRGPRALLSGPAGGVLGAARVAGEAGFESAIGFDMGGTSTDVCVVEGGRAERAFESVVAGVRVRAPMLRVHTVAAGGGSLCRFDGVRLTVGPESAGATPGPICYGSLDASELALTDVNLFLGRIRPERFPFPLDAEAVARRLEALRGELAAGGIERSLDELAAGFVAIANASMAQAIQEVSVGRGIDPRGFALVGFGGAGGQHVCAVARRLGMRTVLLHPLAGLLSAHGIAMAPLGWNGQRDAGRVPLEDGTAPLSVMGILAELEAEGRAALEREPGAAESLRATRLLDLRYVGTETPLPVPFPEDGNVRAAFEALHHRRFGYTREGRAVEVTTARVLIEVTEPGSDAVASPGEPAAASRRAAALADAAREPVYFPGLGRVPAPILARESLAPGEFVEGPAIVLEDTGTVVVEPGFRAEVLAGGLLRLEDREPHPEVAAPEGGAALEELDPVRLEVFGNRFMSIAEQMGAVLRNTAVSTNIKERLDYSCAVFDRDGGLVANAPHIPVHLGAMGATVRAVLEAVPDLAAGDAVVTNDPAGGGSHLPDITVVSPVFVEEELRFFVASRGHHADIGGITPGSMPAGSTSIAEEGVLLRPFPLVRRGRFDEARIRAALTEAAYPARNPDDNVADLEAMLAANRTGESLLLELVAESGLSASLISMQQLQEAARLKVVREIERLPDGVHDFADALDDGTPIRVQLRVHGDAMEIDFAGTGPAVAGNLNAPRAVVEAAVIYVLRALVDERIPLNGGCLLPVRIHVPEGSLLDPPDGAAVVGGNVETSQRVVDVLLGAIGRVAASQGTMNNVAFGTKHFGYYETIGGGAGAGRDFEGASGVHVHMTNTRITDAEVLESRYPVRLERFSIREGSGGAGRQRGGDGLVRRYRFEAPVSVSLLTERRVLAPYGLEGGAPGERGRNFVRRADGSEEEVPGHARLELAAGDELTVETPGGGGFGAPG